jgi:nitrite reductase/ring-hydroxylating ferredoxin subunit
MFSMKTKWLRFAGSFDELENRMEGRQVKPVYFDGKGLLLVKHENRFYLVRNKCPHQGITLEKAQCDKGYIICPWHRYGFDLKTGRGGGGLYLDNYPLEQREDGIYAGFEYFSWF